MTSEPLPLFDLGGLLRFFLLYFLLGLIYITNPFSLLLRNWITRWNWNKYCFFWLLLWCLLLLLNNWRSEYILIYNNIFLFLRRFLLDSNCFLWTNSPFSTCLLLSLRLKLFLFLHSFKSFKDIVRFTNIKRDTWLWRLLPSDWCNCSSKCPFSVLWLLCLDCLLLLLC